MNIMLMNLGLLEIPSLPIPEGKKRPAPPDPNRRYDGAIRTCARMREINVARAEEDLRKMVEHIKKTKKVTTRLVSERFSWTYSKTSDLIQKAHKRELIRKIGAGKAVVWVPA